MAVLHVVSLSPADSKAWVGCLGRVATEDAVLLIADAVYGVCRQTDYSASLTGKEVAVFVLLPDLQARGIHPDELIDAVLAVSFEEFVDLTVEYSQIVSW